jgi:hypothetical protein
VFKLFYTTPINVQYNMPITVGFFSWERINHFHFISYGKNSFGIRPVWYKSKDVERIKDVYRGTTVFLCYLLELDSATVSIKKLILIPK